VGLFFSREWRRLARIDLGFGLAVFMSGRYAFKTGLWQCNWTMPMTPAEFYRQRATECFALADQISDPREREITHELALCWLRLLDRANENGRQAASPDRNAA
jgi:hypothetical protein